MNPLDIAKLLEVDSWYKLITREEVANVIREQQAEIAELKHMNRNWQISEGLALAEIQALRQVLQSIANEKIELSNDKIKWQCEDHIRWAKEVLK